MALGKLYVTSLGHRVPPTSINLLRPFPLYSFSSLFCLEYFTPGPLHMLFFCLAHSQSIIVERGILPAFLIFQVKNLRYRERK